MSAALRAVSATLVGIAATAALVAGSQLPWRASPADTAQLRLSWRSVSEPVKACRKATPEELAALPPHMRMEEICERRHAPFRLVVRVDDRVLRDAILEPAGPSGDRPLYVFEEIPLAPGAHRVAVHFEEQGEGREVASQALSLDASLVLAPRDIALVTLDPSGERLAVLSAGR